MPLAECETGAEGPRQETTGAEGPSQETTGAEGPSQATTGAEGPSQATTGAEEAKARRDGPGPGASSPSGTRRGPACRCCPCPWRRRPRAINTAPRFENVFTYATGLQTTRIFGKQLQNCTSPPPPRVEDPSRTCRLGVCNREAVPAVRARQPQNQRRTRGHAHATGGRRTAAAAAGET